MSNWSGQPAPGIDWESRDREHLRLLRIFHYVMAGVMAAFSLFPIFHVAMGIAFLSGALGPPSGSKPPAPELIGWLFAVGGGAMILIGETMAVLNLLVARYITRRAHHTFCMVVSVINCLNMPMGTALGAFTIVVLSRPGVRAWFDAPPA